MWGSEGGPKIPLIAMMIIDTASGFLATRVMKVNMDVPSTVRWEVFGALIGRFVLRWLIMLTGWGCWLHRGAAGDYTVNFAVKSLRQVKRFTASFRRKPLPPAVFHST